EELVPLDDRSRHRGDDDHAQLSADRLLLGAVLRTYETPSIPQSASQFNTRIAWRVLRRPRDPRVPCRFDAADGPGTDLGTSAARTLLAQASVCVTLQSFGKFLGMIREFSLHIRAHPLCVCEAARRRPAAPAAGRAQRRRWSSFES